MQCIYNNTDNTDNTDDTNDVPISHCEPGYCLGFICQECGMWCTMCDQSIREIDVVAIRLRAYKMYRKGPVVWTNSDIESISVICDPPSDPENPNTYLIPSRDGEKSRTVDCEEIPNGGWNWGTLHAEVEELAWMGWEPNY